jgi:hypothetical protein
VGTRLKFNLVLLFVAAIGVELLAIVSTPFLENIARAEVLQKARIMMESAAGMRNYTSNEIAPLLNARSDDNFHPQTVPAYAANKTFALLADKFNDYAYRETALNPINRANRAVDWEADIINDFRANPNKRELITQRETHNGLILNLSHPITCNGPCLSCHETAEKAPRSMIAVYGTQNGFGWKLNEVVGAQIVSVPMAVALADAATIRNLFIALSAGVFLLLIALFNVLLILTISISRANPHTRAYASMAESIKFFGYGLLVAGVVIVMVEYVVIFATGGIGGFKEALSPFILLNYARFVPIVPGMLIVWLANFLSSSTSGATRFSR